MTRSETRLFEIALRDEVLDETVYWLGGPIEAESEQEAIEKFKAVDPSAYEASPAWAVEVPRV